MSLLYLYPYAYGHPLMAISGYPYLVHDLIVTHVSNVSLKHVHILRHFAIWVKIFVTNRILRVPKGGLVLYSHAPT